MAYQFIHLEAYSREASKQKSKSEATGKSGGRKPLNVRDVIAEGNREPGNCPHVENPQPPTIIFGSLDQAEAEAVAWAEEAKDKQGRKLRKDGHCLLAGVASLPRSEELENWEEFVERTSTYLHDKYGDRLKAVIAHDDEDHPHLHFYVVPRKGERFEDIHEGQKAARQAKAEEKLKGEQNAAYIAAMRQLQDDFSSQVGQPLGLTRLGPRRRRLSRAAWQAEQAQARALAEVERTAKKRHEHYKAQGLAEGLAQGLAQGLAEAKAVGSRVGAVMTGFATGLANRWHSPSKEAKAKADAVKEDAKAYADGVKQRAEQLLQSERLQMKSMQRELDRLKNIAENTEAENKRLQSELDSYRSSPPPSTGKQLKL